MISFPGTGLESKLKVLIAKRECQNDTRKALGESGGNEERSEQLRMKMAEDDAEISKAMREVSILIVARLSSCTSQRIIL